MIKGNVNHFIKSGWMKSTGIILLVAGIACLFFGRGIATYVLTALLVPTGIVFFIVGASIRLTDSEIEEFAAKKYEDFEARLELDKNYSKRMLQHMRAETLESYLYEEGLMFTRSNMGFVRSSQHQKAIIHILSDAVYVSVRKISLVEDKVFNAVFEIPYEKIKDVFIKREERRFEFNKKSFKNMF